MNLSTVYENLPSFLLRILLIGFRSINNVIEICEQENRMKISGRNVLQFLGDNLEKKQIAREDFRNKT